jgi:hypothetical protein
MVRFQMEGIDQAAMRYDSACLSFGNPCVERPLYLAKASQFGGAPRAEKKVKLNQAVLRKGATLDINMKYWEIIADNLSKAGWS